MRQIPTSQLEGYLAWLAASMIQVGKLEELRKSTAFVSKVNNGVGFCIGEDGSLPDFSDDPDTVAFCCLKDVSIWPQFFQAMSTLLALDFQSAKMLADAIKEPIENTSPKSSIKPPSSKWSINSPSRSPWSWKRRSINPSDHALES